LFQIKIGDDDMGCGCGNKRAEEKKFTRNAEYQYKGEDICLKGREEYINKEVTKTSYMVGGVVALVAGVYTAKKLNMALTPVMGYATTAGILTYAGSKGLSAGAKSANSRYDKLCETDDETANETQKNDESYMDDDSPYITRS
tara:strand:+ start:109 stop:537 length:429 start_codon:yes stop_codon:yes gene_type:complete